MLGSRSASTGLRVHAASGQSYVAESHDRTSLSSVSTDLSSEVGHGDVREVHGLVCYVFKKVKNHKNLQRYASFTHYHGRRSHFG